MGDVRARPKTSSGPPIQVRDPMLKSKAQPKTSPGPPSQVRDPMLKSKAQLKTSSGPPSQVRRPMLKSKASSGPPSQVRSPMLRSKASSGPSSQVGKLKSRARPKTKVTGLFLLILLSLATGGESVEVNDIIVDVKPTHPHVKQPDAASPNAWTRFKNACCGPRACLSACVVFLCLGVLGVVIGLPYMRSDPLPKEFSLEGDIPLCVGNN